MEAALSREIVVDTIAIVPMEVARSEQVGAVVHPNRIGYSVVFLNNKGDLRVLEYINPDQAIRKFEWTLPEKINSKSYRFVGGYLEENTYHLMYQNEFFGRNGRPVFLAIHATPGKINLSFDTIRLKNEFYLGIVNVTNALWLVSAENELLGKSNIIFRRFGRGFYAQEKTVELGLHPFITSMSTIKGNGFDDLTQASFPVKAYADRPNGGLAVTIDLLKGRTTLIALDSSLSVRKTEYGDEPISHELTKQHQLGAAGRHISFLVDDFLFRLYSFENAIQPSVHHLLTNEIIMFPLLVKNSHAYQYASFYEEGLPQNQIESDVTRKLEHLIDRLYTTYPTMRVVSGDNKNMRWTVGADKLRGGTYAAVGLKTGVVGAQDLYAHTVGNLKVYQEAIPIQMDILLDQNGRILTEQKPLPLDLKQQLSIYESSILRRMQILRLPKPTNPVMIPLHSGIGYCYSLESKFYFTHLPR